MEQNNDKFSWNFQNDVQFLDDNGLPITDSKSYFEKKMIDDITFQENLEIGDIVEIKKVNYLVEIKKKKIETAIGTYDYAGSILGEESSDLALFNQGDVVTRISQRDCKHK